ncbi:MAG: phosphatidylserine decarboxylase [Candidatus Saganbacteria bacterium]|nr:phosphatidylserine decarboxylase [Candidatus Saganbacteria bacterium]
MKIAAVKFGLIILLLTLPLNGAFGMGQNPSTIKTDRASDTTIVQNLEELLENTPELKKQINKSLKFLGKSSYWQNKSSKDFVEFFKEWRVYNPTPTAPGKYIMLFDELANSKAGEILFNNNVFSSWFIAFLNARGQYLDTNSSAATMDQWMSTPLVKMYDYVIPKGGFKNFNDFFLRPLKSSVRPLGGKNDSAVIVSPADGSICQIYAENLDKNLTIKRDVINIRQALNNSPYANRFIGGSVLDILLWFTNYHRFHAPVSGKIVEVGEYAGSYNYNFSNVNWYQQLAKHKRSCYIIETKKFGLVAMIPVGFWGVGSIITDPKVKVGSYIKKGEEIGHFKYGGSSILLVFEPGAVKLTLPIPAKISGDDGHPVNVRQEIGVAK